MNLVVLQGNLTRDPEGKVVPTKKGDVTVAKFSVAVSEYFTKAGGEKDKRTTFIECEAWDSGADTILKYFSKGSPILVQGSLKEDKWTDKVSGAPRSKLMLRVRDFTILNRKETRAVEQNTEEVVTVGTEETKEPF